MCDQNALLRFLAAQASAQQQMAFGRQTAAPQRALGGPMMGPMLGINPFVAPEMMLWQSMMAAQAQAQMAQLQQQQAQSQPSFDEVLKKLAESAKTGMLTHVGKNS
uniref:STI1 domain-containing protein n=1 Tax=Heterorhabditis bacteriophora TaxID=37862 RepID=A0A1I7X880_HETBA